MKHTLFYQIALGFLICLSNEKSITNKVAKKWQDFKVQFGKVYESAEDEERHLSHFVDNLKLIEYHNKREKREVLGMTQFADQSSQKAPGCTASVNISNSQRTDIKVSPKYAVKDEIDWRKDGYVTPVQNQDKPKQCGSCWAFSTTGAIESHIAKLRKKKAVKLSAQQLVDCSETTPNAGCTGGHPLSALKDVKKTGIATSQVYPYKGIAGPCQFSKSKTGARIIGYKILKKNDEQELKEAVAIMGPVSVTIDTTMLHHYKAGTVFNMPECKWHYDSRGKVSSILHSVLVVGYGTDENGTDYWLIKNSWGTNWGDQGYFRLARNKGNRCGIAKQAIYPVLLGEVMSACTWKTGNQTLASASKLTEWICTSNGIKHQFNGFFLFGSFAIMVIS